MKAKQTGAGSVQVETDYHPGPLSVVCRPRDRTVNRIPLYLIALSVIAAGAIGYWRWVLWRSTSSKPRSTTLGTEVFWLSRSRIISAARLPIS